MKSPLDVVHREPTAFDSMSAQYKDQIGLQALEIRESLARYVQAADLEVTL